MAADAARVENRLHRSRAAGIFEIEEIDGVGPYRGMGGNRLGIVES